MSFAKITSLYKKSIIFFLFLRYLSEALGITAHMYLFSENVAVFFVAVMSNFLFSVLYLTFFVPHFFYRPYSDFY